MIRCNDHNSFIWAQVVIFDHSELPSSRIWADLCLLVMTHRSQRTAQTISLLIVAKLRSRILRMSPVSQPGQLLSQIQRDSSLPPPSQSWSGINDMTDLVL